MTQYGVILFHTTSAVMRAEKLLGRQGFAINLIPTPRQFSSDCGISLRFGWGHRGQVTSVLNGAGIEVDLIHVLDT